MSSSTPRGATLVLGALVIAATAAYGGYRIAGVSQNSMMPAMAPSPPSSPDAQGKLLYYRNPMGLADTSPTPKKDSMGMDYIPVYESEGADPSTVRISLDKIQKLGVRSERAEMRSLTRILRATGTVQAPESGLRVVSLKFEGWVEKLYVNASGAPVRKGDLLMDVYSPSVITAELNYTLALSAKAYAVGDRSETASQGRTAEVALDRLRYLDIPENELQRLRREGRVTRLISVYSPGDGVVLEKPVVEGMRFDAGAPLYRLADLSTVWLMADIYEQDIAAIDVGQSVRVTFTAFPGEIFIGRVSLIYPILSRETRTAKARIEIANGDGRLRGDMYGAVEISVSVGAANAVTVSRSAVLDNGLRQIVLVDRGDGRFEPRSVRLGARSDDYIEISSGLDAGESVVVSANFLIDAESNLRAAIAAFVSGSPPSTSAAPANDPSTPVSKP
ncbi:MAG: efflux RND transporter periplasmic adaptor subunit [Rhodospirillales bacterium]